MSAHITPDIVNALLEPVFDVLKTCAGVESHVSRMEFVDELPPAPRLSVTVEVSGRIVGPIVWSFDPEVARKLAAGMLATPDLPVFGSPDCNDALSELANVIVGNATGALLEAGYAVELAPPKTNLAYSPP